MSTKQQEKPYDHSKQKRLDELSGIIGPEESLRGHLADVECEISKLSTAMAPLASKRVELLGKLSKVAAARSEAAALKASR